MVSGKAPVSSSRGADDGPRGRSHCRRRRSVPRPPGQGALPGHGDNRVRDHRLLGAHGADRLHGRAAWHQGHSTPACRRPAPARDELLCSRPGHPRPGLDPPASLDLVAPRTQLPGRPAERGGGGSSGRLRSRHEGPRLHAERGAGRARRRSVRVPSGVHQPRLIRISPVGLLRVDRDLRRQGHAAWSGRRRLC